MCKYKHVVVYTQLIEYVSKYVRSCIHIHARKYVTIHVVVTSTHVIVARQKSGMIQITTHRTRTHIHDVLEMTEGVGGTRTHVSTRVYTRMHTRVHVRT